MNETAESPARREPPRWHLPFGWLLAGVVLSLTVAAVAASFLLTAAVLNSDLAAQIRRTTGFITEIRGSARFVLLPQPHIDIDAISFANPAAGLRVDTASFTGYLRILPLLAGHVDVGHAVLYQPKMLIDVDDRPMTPESTLGRAAEAKSASPQAAAIDRTKLAIVDLVEGSARLRRHGLSDLVFDNLDLTADWRSLDASATLTGQFSFAHQQMQVKAWLAQPVELLRGGSSATTVQLDSRALKIVTNGNLTTAARLQYKGSLTASAPALRMLSRLAGYSVGKTGRFDDFELHGDMTVNGRVTTLANVRLHLDDNDYEGTLAVEAGDKTLLLSGTLATNLLDLTPFLEGLPRPSDEAGRWNDAPLELTDLGFTTLDLRLSATRLRFNDIEVKDAALSLLTRPGFIDLALAEANAYGGTLKGRLTLEGSGGDLDLRASAVGSGIDLEPMWPSGPLRHPLSGTLSGSIMVTSKGRSFAALMHGFTGHAQIEVINGRLTGVALADALRGSPTRLFPSRSQADQTVTAFETARFSAQIDQGVAKVGDGQLMADALTVHFGGSADIGERTLDLWAMARPRLAPDTMTDLPPLALSLQGPWDNLHAAADRPAPSAEPSAQPSAAPMPPAAAPARGTQAAPH